MDTRSREEILRELENVPEEKVKQILELIHRYRLGIEDEMKGVKSKAFSELCGSISFKDIKLMEAAIEDCERIDSNGW